MELKNKTNAFTIVELLVVLLLTSIVIGIVFSVHQFVNAQFYQKSILEKRDQQINFMEMYLWRNLNTSITSISGTNDGLLFKKGNLENELIIEENFIIVNKDTFELKTEEFYFYNKGREVNKGRVDALKLLINLDKDRVKEVFVFKQQDVESILNNE